MQSAWACGSLVGQTSGLPVAKPPVSYVFSVLQSQRDCVLQPRVVRNELPWVGGPSASNPEGVSPRTLNTYFGGEGRGEEAPLHFRERLFEPNGLPSTPGTRYSTPPLYFL